MRIYIIFILIIVSIYSCDKSDVRDLDNSFVNCKRITGLDAIYQNLIGNWVLIGYGCGECLPNYSIPKYKLELQDSIGVFYSEIDRAKDTVDFDWKMFAAADVNDSLVIKFETNPNSIPIHMDYFCEQYMWMNDTYKDGLALTYKKED